ncbi:MAG: hypothetical protein VKO26_01700 [Cyanobacteriota bacterium]|nr:hypothetical protein [Cyanobacteriota bacterium]
MALGSVANLAAAPEPHSDLARGGGGGGRGGFGGGGGLGGGGGRGGGGPARTGFSGGGSFTRGDRQPSGGFSGGDRLNRVGNPSIRQPVSRPASGASGAVRPGDPRRPAGGLAPTDRRAFNGERPIHRDGTPTLNRAGDRTLNLDRGDRTLNLDRGNRSIQVNRDWTRQVNIGDINLHPGWARPGWGVARPWNWGWYGGWSNPPWGWWGARAAAWGIGTLATAAVVNAAVNAAVASDVTTIVVPNSNYLLQFGTVQPIGNGSVTFVVTVDDSSWQLTADCNAGTLNGRVPNTSQEAELLNAACQVAFGQAS